MTMTQEQLGQLGQKYRAWIVELAQECRLDPTVTRLLTEVVDRRAGDLETARRQVFDQELEDEIHQLVAQNVWAALNNGPAFDRLFQPIIERAEQRDRKGIREVFLSEQTSFGDQWLAVQAFLDQAFPIEDTGGEP